MAVDDDRFGRYRLVRRIGGGGMADVFRAELVGAEGVTRELVVKKVLHTLSLDREAVEMFVQEARVAARLHHPNVVQVYEFARAGDGYFLAMELVEGCDLAALFKVHVGVGLPLPVTAWVFQELLEALAYVHGLTDADGRALGLVHRDVSPHNVLLGRAGEVKLADFGIATASARVYDEGIKGKFAYMAPEQARGEHLDARADLYAVGAMLYEALVGRRALPTREAEAMLDAARRGALETLDEVAVGLHPALVRVLKQALASRVEERFPDATAFRVALAEAMTTAGVVPDRARLQAMVRAQAPDAEVSEADRTLTAHDDTDSNNLSAGANEDPVKDDDSQSFGHEPSPARSPRRLFERVMIAVGIFTLAVLAERRTRPVATPARVTVALPDERAVRQWFDDTGREAAGARCRCRVAARYYRRAAEVEAWLRQGDVALAVVTSVTLPQVLPFVGQAGEGALVHARPTVLRALRGLPGGASLVPVAVDPVVMAVRDDVLRAGGARFMARRDAVVAAVDGQVGHGFPGGFAWRDDPAGWTWWDVLAAGWVGRTSGGTSAQGGVSLGLEGERGLGTWYALAGPWDEDRSSPNDLLGVAETAAWSALFGALGLLGSGGPDASRDAVYIGPARDAPTAGWTVFPPPRDVAVVGGVPRRPSDVELHAEVLGWVVRTPSLPAGRVSVSAPLPSSVSSVLAGVTAAEVSRALARAWRGVPAWGDASKPSEPELVGISARSERLVDRGYVAVVAPPRGAAGGVAAALDRVMAQARSGTPRPFVGSGRWWWPTIRDAVARAFAHSQDPSARAPRESFVRPGRFEPDPVDASAER